MLATTLAATLTATTTTAAPQVSSIADVFAWTAGGIGIFVGLPQAWRLWVGRRHAGLSLTSNTLAVLYSVAWLLYGVASHRSAMVVTSSIGLGVASTILLGHIRLGRPPTREWLPLCVTGLALAAALFVAGRGPLGLAASAATITGVTPQLVVLVREHRQRIYAVGGVSIARWSLSVTCNLLWATYGFLVHDPLIVGNSAIIAALSGGIVLFTMNAAREEMLLVGSTKELAMASA